MRPNSPGLNYSLGANMLKLLASVLIALLVRPAVGLSQDVSGPLKTTRSRPFPFPKAGTPSLTTAASKSTSADGAIYVAVEMVKAADVASATEEGIEWFAKQGVKIDPKSIATRKSKSTDSTPSTSKWRAGQGWPGPE